MKNTKRNQPRRAARTLGQVGGLRDSLEAKLLKFCADIGWICGWREQRLEPAPSARRSSRKRVMLGRVMAEEARMWEAEAFRSVEATFVTSGRNAYSQAESAAEASGFADIANDLQDELARIGRMGISTSALIGAVGHSSRRSFGRQLWEQRQSLM